MDQCVECVSIFMLGFRLEPTALEPPAEMESGVYLTPTVGLPQLGPGLPLWGEGGVF